MNSVSQKNRLFILLVLLLLATALGATSAAPVLLSPIRSQVVEPGGLRLDLSAHFQVTEPSVPTVRVDTTLGAFHMELLSESAPATVENFLAYVHAGAYGNALFHRSVPGFIIQTGGFTATLPPVDIPARDPVVNEFKLSNLRGTVAMAKLGTDPNSATNQWFVNLADNSANLDSQNGGFTVFARVLSQDMTVVDALAAVPVLNAGGVFSELPLRGMKAGQTAVGVANLLAVNSVATLPYYATSSNSQAFSVRTNGGQLVILPRKQANKGAVITVHATEIAGGEIKTTFTVKAGPARAFAGLLQAVGGPTLLTLNLEASGAFTGVLSGSAGTQRFAKVFDPLLATPVAISLSNNQTLSLTYNQEAGEVRATLGNLTAELFPAAHSGAAGALSPLAGRVVNAVFLAESAVGSPKVGDGFAQFRFDKTGTAKVAGRLPDGAAFSASARALAPEVTDALRLPLAVFRTGKVPMALTGNLSVNLASSSDLGGSLQWSRALDSLNKSLPGPISAAMEVLGSRWTFQRNINALTGGGNSTSFRLVLDPDSSVLPALLTGNGTWPATNKPTIGDPPALSLAFTTSSGLFSGKFLLPAIPPAKPKSTTFQGLLLGHSVSRSDSASLHGAGFFLGANASASVQILSTP